jgi:hypothetical protein
MTVATKTASRGSSRLAVIAATMYRNAAIPGAWDRVALPSGLNIILHRVTDQRWRLALARESVYPSDVEVQVIRAAFAVPVDADETRGEKLHRHPKTGREITYRRIEITWLER